MKLKAGFLGERFEVFKGLFGVCKLIQLFILFFLEISIFRCSVSCAGIKEAYVYKHM